MSASGSSGGGGGVSGSMGGGACNGAAPAVKDGPYRGVLVSVDAGRRRGQIEIEIRHPHSEPSHEILPFCYSDLWLDHRYHSELQKGMIATCDVQQLTESCPVNDSNEVSSSSNNNNNNSINSNSGNGGGLGAEDDDGEAATAAAAAAGGVAVHRRAVCVRPADDMVFNGVISVVNYVEQRGEIQVKGLSTQLGFRLAHLPSDTDFNLVREGDSVKVEIGFWNFVTARKPPQPELVYFVGEAAKRQLLNRRQHRSSEPRPYGHYIDIDSDTMNNHLSPSNAVAHAPRRSALRRSTSNGHLVDSSADEADIAAMRARCRARSVDEAPLSRRPIVQGGFAGSGGGGGGGLASCELCYHGSAPLSPHVSPAPHPHAHAHTHTHAHSHSHPHTANHSHAHMYSNPSHFMMSANGYHSPPRVATTAEVAAAAVAAAAAGTSNSANSRAAYSQWGGLRSSCAMTSLHGADHHSSGYHSAGAHTHSVYAGHQHQHQHQHHQPSPGLYQTGQPQFCRGDVGVGPATMDSTSVGGRTSMGRGSDDDDTIIEITVNELREVVRRARTRPL